MIRTMILTAALIAALSVMSGAYAQRGTFKDPRDGKTYRTVKIGNLTWMAQDLDYRQPRSKDNLRSGKNDNDNYGQYSWYLAKSACPEGWRLPTSNEFYILIAEAGGRDSAGANLKARTGWKVSAIAGNGNDKFGFSALPNYKAWGAGSAESSRLWGATNDAPYLLEIRSTGGTSVEGVRGANSGEYSVRCICADAEASSAVPVTPPAPKNETGSKKWVAGQTAPALVGTWFIMSDQRTFDGFPDEKLQLSANGTGMFDGFSPLKWKAENGRIYINLPDNELEYVCKYTVSGATLILTREDNGRNLQYSKTAKQKAAFLNKTTFAAVSVNTGSENNAPNAAVTADGDKTAVYISGGYAEGNESKACYWRNGVRTDLHVAGEQSHASAIAVAAGSVYLAGYYHYDTTGDNKIACYWKDGVRTDLHHDALIREGEFLSTNVDSKATAITVSGNTTYIAGHYGIGIGYDSHITACYWKADAKNITRTILYKVPIAHRSEGIVSDGSVGNGSEANAIAVLGNTVYTIGNYINYRPSIKQKACYWKDDKKTDLPEGPCRYHAHKAVVSGNSVYISGYYVLVNPVSKECSDVQYCYWKDGVKTVLFDKDPLKTGENPLEIAVSGNTVYTTGHYLAGDKQRACYWEGAARKDLDVPQNAGNSGAGPITIVENAVYIAGYYEQGEGAHKKQIPCYWINGKRTDIPAPAGAKNYWATGIAVGVSGKTAPQAAAQTAPLAQGAAVTAAPPNTFTDPRDGQTYRTVKMGKLTWMAQNLNFKPQTGNTGCNDNNNSNCNKYGRLYAWDAAMEACPAGWRLPTRQEWSDLVGPVEFAGNALKSKTGWSTSGNGTDKFGFSALPGGSGFGYNNGKFTRFVYAGNDGYWWSATENGSYHAWYRDMNYSHVIMYEGNDSKGRGLSVRCVQ
ncbi:MAG: hypothetical protein FWC04_05410 [Chitinispirillia bacterium]|nr:hypothetical protein [Chitinispirillia bacterium]MCL2241942.1 hypothetical protein [Chitinispirillia bacterium]